MTATAAIERTTCQAMNNVASSVVAPSQAVENVPSIFVSVTNVNKSNKLVAHDMRNRRYLELFRKGEGDGDSSATSDRCEKSGTHSLCKMSRATSINVQRVEWMNQALPTIHVFRSRPMQSWNQLMSSSSLSQFTFNPIFILLYLHTSWCLL